MFWTLLVSHRGIHLLVLYKIITYEMCETRRSLVFLKTLLRI